MKKKTVLLRQKYNVILHADDLGRSRNINSMIFESIDEGFVRGVSIIVGQEFSIQGIIGARKRDIKMRLHLNLTEGKASAKHNLNTSLVNKNGFFTQSFFSLFLAPFKINFSRFKNDVNKEINFQIKEYLKISKLKNFNLDGHQHIHCIPWISKIIMELTSKYNIKEIRVPNDTFCVFNLLNFLKSWYYINLIKFVLLKILSKDLVKKAEKNRIKFNEKFIGVLYTGHMCINSIRHGIEKLKNIKKHSSLEILIHPFISDVNEKKYWNNRKQHHYYLQKERLKEFTLAKDVQLKKMLVKYDNFINNKI